MVVCEICVFVSVFCCVKESLEFGSEVLGYEVKWGAVGGAKHVMPLPQSPCVASLTHLSPDTAHTARVKVSSPSLSPSLSLLMSDVPTGFE